MARSIIAGGPQYHRGWGRPGVGRSMRADGGVLVRAAVSARRPAGHGGAAEVTCAYRNSSATAQGMRVGSRWNYEIARLTAGFPAVIPKFQHFEILQI